MIKGNEIRMTPYEMAEAIRTWCNYPGFTAEKCSCGATVNTFAGCPGYHCPKCDRYNCQSWSCHQIPHQHPDFGPSLRDIRKGGKINRRFLEKSRKFSIGQRVWADRCHWPMTKTVHRIQPGRIIGFGDALRPSLTWYHVEFDDGHVDKAILEQHIQARAAYRIGYYHHVEGLDRAALEVLESVV